MKHTGEKISPCNTPRSMLNGSDNMLSPLGCCCCKDRLDDASDFDADPGIREGAIEEKLTFGVERGAIIYEGDNHCVNNHDLDKQPIDAICCINLMSFIIGPIWKATP